MPKIKIREIDKTGSVQSSAISNTVYIPGKVLDSYTIYGLIESEPEDWTSAWAAKYKDKVYRKSGETYTPVTDSEAPEFTQGTFYQVIDSHVATPVEPKLFRSISELRAFNYDNYKSGVINTPKYYDVDSLSYKLMVHLLEYGIYVLFEGIIEEEDGSCPVIDWTRLEDKGLYDIRFLTMGGYGVTQDGMLTCASNRGDCVALLDHPVILDPVKEYNPIATKPEDWSSAWTTKYKGKVYKSEGDFWVVVDSSTAPTFVANTFHTLTLNDDQVATVRQYFEAHKGSAELSYVAAFTPGFKSSLESLGGSIVTPVHIPASFGYLFAYAKAIKSNPDWYAVAGSFRGTINELTSVEYEYKNSEIEMLQGRAKSSEVPLDDEEDNVGCAINCIAYVRPFGHIIWGNRTFLENTASKKTVATSFLNVRNLVSTVKKSLYDAARKYTFEQNSELLWVNFKAQIIPLLDSMKNGNGILGYKFVRLATSAKARLKARLIIMPIEAVEDFELEVELADSISTTEE